MSPVTLQSGPAPRRPGSMPPAWRDWERFSADLGLAWQNLRAQKVRTVLTALGMIFGVGAVIAMLSIGAGARAQSLRLIEQLGVRNLLIDSIPATSQQQLQQRRQTSHGLNQSDLRMLQANVPGVRWITPRREMRPAALLPRPQGAWPEVYGVSPVYARIHHLQVAQGRFFDATDDAAGAADCVLGSAIKVQMLGYRNALGRWIKINDVWFRVIGVLGSGPNSAGGGDRAIYIPFNAFEHRIWNADFSFKDPLDGVDIALQPSANVLRASAVAEAILATSHHGAHDYRVVAPAALLAAQERTQRIFTLVMVAIAAISLLVGGIGIMNIVLATVLERTREIGVRRATGARRGDILRQFLSESLLISLSGGLMGVVFGLLLSRLIAWSAGWQTIVTLPSILVAFGVSAAVGVIFGLYPARKAARIDPIEALRYE